jgi:hypothetical protein
MTHIEKLHSEGMSFVDGTKSEESRKYYKIKKSAEITENIAIEFVEWVERNKLDSSGKYLHIFHLSPKDLFQEYLKSKENEIQTNQQDNRGRTHLREGGDRWVGLLCE